VHITAAAGLLAEMIDDPSLLEPPINAYRMALHPRGLVPRLVDVAAVAHHLVARLRHDVAVSADPALAELLDEVVGYGTFDPTVRHVAPDRGVVVPLRLRHPTGELQLFSTVATFGTPIDVTVAELAIETFFPADRQTADRLRALADAR
jgi:hypothetical protein